MPETGLDIDELDTASGFKVGCLTLDMPKTLNALTLPIVDAMAAQLTRWAQNDSVVAILLKGGGTKSFCAGGDIQSLYRAMYKNHAAGKLADSYAEDFFEREYRLDYQLHTYPKPVLCWGHGLVMGGGLGLFRASSHRVATEYTRAAMPEITIGLFPDAGGTELLAALPGKMGLFLGLTGVHFNGADVLGLGIGTHFIRHALLPEVLVGMVSTAWKGDAEADATLMNMLLNDYAGQSKHDYPDALVLAHTETIDEALAHCQSYGEIIDGILQLETRDGWFAKGVANLKSGCPVTAGIVVEQMARAPGLCLEERFQMELIMAVQCARHPDFAEGVRALLIDKDNKPAWQYPDLKQLPAAAVEAHFEAPWANHPLADLGTS